MWSISTVPGTPHTPNVRSRILFFCGRSCLAVFRPWIVVIRVTHRHPCWPSVVLLSLVAWALIAVHRVFLCSAPTFGKGLSSCSAWAQLLCDMWDPGSLTRDQTCVPCVARQIHWTTREVPSVFFGVLLVFKFPIQFIFSSFIYLFGCARC